MILCILTKLSASQLYIIIYQLCVKISLKLLTEIKIKIKLISKNKFTI